MHYGSAPKYHAYRGPNAPGVANPQQRMMAALARNGGTLTIPQAIQVAGRGYRAVLGALNRRGLVVRCGSTWRRAP